MHRQLVRVLTVAVVVESAVLLFLGPRSTNALGAHWNVLDIAIIGSLYFGLISLPIESRHARPFGRLRIPPDLERSFVLFLLLLALGLVRGALSHYKYFLSYSRAIVFFLGVGYVAWRSRPSRQEAVSYTHLTLPTNREV